jgi:hypothetical protein
MKKILISVIIVSFFFSCNDKKGLPDISEIDVDVKIERFDREFFAIDTNQVLNDLNQVNKNYPVLTPLFLQNILGLDSGSTIQGVSHFLQLSDKIKDTINNVFKSTNDIEQDFEKAFRYLKFYFPTYPVPRIITVVGPMDALAQSNTGYTPNFLGADFLGISLQFYLGKNFSLYQDPYFVENVAPSYRSRRFSKEYIIGDAMQLIVDDLFPDNSGSRPLIEQMIEKGKQWWLLDKLLPEVADSVKTGYTADQLEWCRSNEGLVWTYLLKNEDIYSINPATIQTYIGEGPFTQGMSQEYSPGNLGQWIGWQIVSRYAEKNPSVTVEQVMKTNSRKILDEAKYRPK